ncbi:hypothetical protein BS78_10G169900 [Paspalum vaginatum]|nr:hypothetical protein BS78_10G169900 [Paspalum vaginatum]
MAPQARAHIGRDLGCDYPAASFPSAISPLPILCAAPTRSSTSSGRRFVHPRRLLPQSPPRPPAPPPPPAASHPRCLLSPSAPPPPAPRPPPASRQMDRLVHVFHGGIVRENGEFENMREELEIFDSLPTFFELVARTQRLLGGLAGQTEVMLRGRFDSGKSRAHYVLMKICSAFDWETYKEIVNSSNVTCFEVVAEMQTMSDFVRVKKEAVEAMLKLGEVGGEVKGQMARDRHSAPNMATRMDGGSSQDSRDGGSYRTFDMCDNFDRAVVSDRIDGTSFNEMEEDDDGDISLGSDEEEEEADEEEEEEKEGEEEEDAEEDEEEEEEEEKKEGEEEEDAEEDEEEEKVSGEEDDGGGGLDLPCEDVTGEET